MGFGDLPPLSQLESPTGRVRELARRSEKGAKAGDMLAPVTQRFLRIVVATGTPPAITASPEPAGSRLRGWSLLQPWPLAGVESPLVTLSCTAHPPPEVHRSKACVPWSVGVLVWPPPQAHATKMASTLA